MGWSTCVTGALWVTCLALFFQAVGFAIPFWVSFVDDSSGTDFGVFVGVWYTMACIKGESDSCKSKAIKPEFDNAGFLDDVKIEGNSQEFLVELTAQVFGYNAYWWVIQITTTVGLFLTLLAALILICCRCAGIHSRCSFVSAAILLLFGGCIALAISILTAVVLGVTFAFADFDIDAETFPWSVLLFGVGGMLALVAGVMVMIIICKWRRYGAYESEDKDSLDEVPMSHVNDAYGRDPYESARKEYNNYDRTRYGYDRTDPRNYGGSRRNDYRGDTRDYRDNHRDNHRDGYRDRDNYDYGRSYSSSRQGQDYMYRPYNQPRY